MGSSSSKWWSAEEWEAARAFARCARRYANWFDQPITNPRSDAQSIFLLLSELHFRANQLPSTEDINPLLEAEDIPDHQRLLVKASRLPIDEYWNVSNVVEDREVIPGTVRGDECEIYSDLIGDLNLFDKGMIDDAVWGWQETFTTHWGHHCLDAMKALYDYLHR